MAQSDTELLIEIRELLGQLFDRVDEIEREFAPLARKYSRIVGAAASLPGAGWRGRASAEPRFTANGRTGGRPQRQGPG